MTVSNLWAKFKAKPDLPVAVAPQITINLVISSVVRCQLSVVSGKKKNKK
jgi:uncharacterized protein YejL (UPF0352 family)